MTGQYQIVCGSKCHLSYSFAPSLSHRISFPQHCVFRLVQHQPESVLRYQIVSQRQFVVEGSQKGELCMKGLLG